MLKKTAELSNSSLYRISELQNYNLCAVDGAIGPLEDMNFDDSTWTARFIVVNAANWLKGRRVIISTVAIGEIDEENNEIFVEISRDQIKGSPPMEEDLSISRKYEDDYFRYYGWPPYWESTPFEPPIPLAEKKLPSSTKGNRLADIHLRSILEMMDYNIAAEDGEIGHVTDCVIDEKNWTLCYLEIDTGKWLSDRRVLLNPAWIESVDWPMRNVVVNLEREAIHSAPAYDPRSVISRDYEIKLFEHYGRQKYWD
jgi:hypothetical protein